MELLDLEQVKRAVMVCVLANRPVGLWGIPGIGKSSILFQIAQQLLRKLYDFNTSSIEASDIGGIPFVVDSHTEAGVTRWIEYMIARGLLPFDTDEKCIILLDEFDRATPQVHAVFQRILLTGEINGHRISPNARWVLAGNGVSDIYTTPLSEALRNRFCHLYIDHTAPGSLDSWLSWASEVRTETVDGVEVELGPRVHPMVQGFIKAHPGNLTAPAVGGSVSRRQIEELAAARPRSWEAVSQVVELLEVMKVKKPDFKTNDILPAIVAGMVGSIATHEFLSFCELYLNAPSIEEILAHPDTAAVPTNVDILYSLNRALNFQARRGRDVAEAVAIYGLRWEDEPREFLFAELLKAQPAVATTEAYRKWNDTRLKDANKASGRDDVDRSMIPAILATLKDATPLPDSDLWVNIVRFQGGSGVYKLSQNRKDKFWACSCRGWINSGASRHCKHLADLGSIIRQPVTN